MTKPVISVEHLTKQYDLGVIGTGTISRDLNRWWARVRKQPDPYTRIGQKDAFERIGESILALDDVSFTVQQGEALGIIGRNGAGKSTLLKILSRVTAPTSGVVKVKGRIGSLLEVGTGFHPELTGRENVYLNGAILGMKKEEVTRKFDEIVDFSGVEKFIDTPVKRYSSGMYVRLAFAVAAHLDPEILIVDEVLAVGDAEFQKKCLGKMGDVTGEGRTVLFVSHNLGAIVSLCTQSCLLERGKIAAIGGTNEIIEIYQNQIDSTIQLGLNYAKDRRGDQSVRVEDLNISVKGGNQILNYNSELIFSIGYSSKNEKTSNVAVLLGIYNETNQAIYFLNSKMATGQYFTLDNKGLINCVTHPINLSSGIFQVNIAILVEDVIVDHIQRAATFTIEKGDFFKTGIMLDQKTAPLYINHSWSVTR